MTHYTRHKLAGVPSLVTATGAQLAAAIVLLPLAYAFWPTVMPDLKAWLAVIGLGVGCTALAFALFFWLLAQVGASRAVTVTFLIPVFGVLWGSNTRGQIEVITRIIFIRVILHCVFYPDKIL